MTAGATLLGGVAGTSPRRTAAEAAGPNIQGVVWQPDYATIDPHGKWDKLGAHQLLVQWTVADGLSFVLSEILKPALKIPDWTRISREPWAQEVILGLATLYDEKKARQDVSALAQLSKQVLQLPTPLNVVGWYFPVEVDPTWIRVRQLGDALRGLPRPLWITVYDNINLGPGFLVDWLDDWLPHDVGVFFQDGVGAYARSARFARIYADVLAEALGKDRLKIIVEAVRPKVGGGYRPATLEELQPQLAAYGDHRLFLFEGPHYLSDALVCALSRSGNGSTSRC